MPPRTVWDAATNAVLDEYTRALRRRGVLESSVAAMVTVAGRWAKFCRSRPFDATRHDVERYLDQHANTSAANRYKQVSLIHRFYRWAVQAGHTDTDPTVYVDRPKLRPGLPRPIPTDDLALALALAAPVMRAALLLASTSGLRCAELAGLRWDDVDLVSRSARVTGKGRRERVVPLHRDTIAALELLPRHATHVLPWQHPGKVSQSINKYLHSIGSTGTAHQLRHWCATNALSATGNLRLVQDLLGHASPATTAVYAALDASLLAAAVDGIVVPAYIDLDQGDQLDLFAEP